MGFGYLEQSLFFNNIDNFSCFKPLENYPAFFCDKIDEFEYDFYGYVCRGENLVFKNKKIIRSPSHTPDTLPDYYGFTKYTTPNDPKYPKILPFDLVKKIKKTNFNLIQTQTILSYSNENPWMFENKMLLECIKNTDIIIPTRKLYRFLIRKLRDSTHIESDLLDYYFIDKNVVFESLDRYLQVNKSLLKCFDKISVKYKLFDMEIYDMSILNLDKRPPWDGVQEGKSYTHFRRYCRTADKYNDQIVFDCLDEYMKLRNYTEDTYLHEI